jgi:3-phenylpropionate/cinnamic acid dioxygenase small subunit
VKIGARPIMRVIETETRWLRSENYSAHSVRWDEGRSFFGSAIHISGDHLTMPVQLLRSVGVVVDFDRGRLTFFETQ